MSATTTSATRQSAEKSSWPGGKEDRGAMSRPRPTPRVREKSSSAASAATPSSLEVPPSTAGPISSGRTLPPARTQFTDDDEDSFFTRRAVRPMVVSSGESSRSSDSERSSSGDSEDGKRRRRRKKNKGPLGRESQSKKSDGLTAAAAEKGKGHGRYKEDDGIRAETEGREERRVRDRSSSLTPPPELDSQVKARIQQLVEMRTRGESRGQETEDSDEEDADESLPLNLEELDPDLIRNARGKRGIELRKRYKELEEERRRRGKLDTAQKVLSTRSGPEERESSQDTRPRKRSKSKSASLEERPDSSARRTVTPPRNVQAIVIDDDSGSDFEPPSQGTVPQAQSRTRSQRQQQQRRAKNDSSDSEVEFISALQTQSSALRSQAQQVPSVGSSSRVAVPPASRPPAPRQAEPEEREPVSAMSTEERITVTLRGGEGGIYKIPVKVKKTTLVSRLRAHFIDTKKDVLTPAQAAKVRLLFDGEVLDGKQTIADIDVEDDDLIDVEW